MPAPLINPGARRPWPASANPASDASALEWVAIASLALVGLWLRTIGMSFGLPEVYNPDEVAIMSRALAFAKGDLNPHNFLYPTFYFYVLFGWIGGYYVVGRVLGWFPSLAAFQNGFFLDPSGIYLAGRLLGALTGTATIVATWWLGRRLFGRAVGLMAALFLAVAPLAVRDAHYVKHDVPVTLAIVLAVMAIVRVWPMEGADRLPGRDIALAGAACGVALSTHYYAALVGLPLAYAIWQRERVEGPGYVGRGWLLGGTAMVAVFLLLSPFLIVEPLTAWRDVVANRQIVVDRAVGGTGVFGSAAAYAGMLWSETMGWPVTLLALVGIGWLLVTVRSRAALLLLFPLVFLAFISNTVAASRYLNPVLPFLALFAAVGCSALSRRVAWRRTTVVAVVALLAALPGLMASQGAGRFFRQPDTRTLALEWVEAHLPAGATVLVQPYSVPLTQSHDGLVEALRQNLGDPARASTKFAIRLGLDPYPSPAYRTIFLGDGGLDADKIYVGYGALGGTGGLDALRRLGVRYLILKRYNRPDPTTVPFLEAVGREGLRLAVFSPYRAFVSAADASRVEPFLHNTDARITPALERPGPVVEIWQLDDAGSPNS